MEPRPQRRALCGSSPARGSWAGASCSLEIASPRRALGVVAALLLTFQQPAAVRAAALCG